MAKQFFKDNNIEYTDYDVASNEEKAHEIVHKTGQMGVPVIIIEDDKEEKIMIGFNQHAVEEALGLSK